MIILSVQDFPWYLEVTVAASAAKSGIFYSLAHLHFGLTVHIFKHAPNYNIYPLNQQHKKQQQPNEFDVHTHRLLYILYEIYIHIKKY